MEAAKNADSMLPHKLAPHCEAMLCIVRSIPLPYAGYMKKDTSVNVRLTSELRDELQRLADADDRKLSAYIALLLAAHVDEMTRASSEPSRKKR